jgi:hypothetical protein
VRTTLRFGLVQLAILLAPFVLCIVGFGLIIANDDGARLLRRRLRPPRSSRP